MTTQKDTQKKLLATLAELGGGMASEDDLTFSGSKLVVPESMTIADAINYLYEKQEELETETSFSRTFPYRPYDGARCAALAMAKAFGTTMQKGIRTMFGTQPPELLTIAVGPGETEQVPWGMMVVPALPGASIYFAETYDNDRGALFRVVVRAPKKYRAHVEGLFVLIERELATSSIYRSKAFDGSGEFLDLDGIDPNNVVYSKDVLLQLEANLWSLLRHTGMMRVHGMSLKRSVLLEGPYGTGKTLAAFLTAQEAVKAGWTFLYCRPGRDNIGEVMQTAALYQPSVVFFEDVDVISNADKFGDDAVSRLLDVFDGMTAKGTEIVAVLTTNHVDRIHKGMVRPGRLDAIVHIGALDRDGIETLTRATIPKSLLDPSVDFDAIAKAMEGYMPAFVKEAIDRSLRYSISRGNGIAETITTEDLCNAANGLRAQFELMENAEEHKGQDSLGMALSRVVTGAVDGVSVVDTDTDNYVAYKLSAKH